MLLMIALPAWALLWKMFNPATGWYAAGNYLLLGISLIVLLLQVWMVIEGALIWPRVRGALEATLPPISARAAAAAETEP